ncbi:MAG: phosphatase PAP2 family protein [Gemmatimonadales bacterium]|jgi:membrane-associated phospholipid phosphatase
MGVVRRAAGVLALWTALQWAGSCVPLLAQSPVAFESPSAARWDSGDWLAAGVVAGASTGSYLVEERLRSLLLNNRSGVADAMERVGWMYGSPVFTVPASLLTLGIGALAEDNDVRDTGLMMGEVLLSALLVQQPVRIAVGRARPFMNEGHLSFQPFTLGNDYASFISGHAWSAFGISNIVARQIDRPWARVGFYSLATITALSRLYSDSHWLTDVLLGSVLGYVVSTAIWKAEHDEAPAADLSLLPPQRRWVTISISL